METLPVHVFSEHLPLSPDHGGPVWPRICRACGDVWLPCPTFKRQLTGQCDNKEEQMGAHMFIWYLRLMSRPEMAFLGPEVHSTMLGWIDAAVDAQRTLVRAREAARTGARRAVQRITTFARNWRDSVLTDGNGRRPVMGQPSPPPRGTVQFGEVVDGDQVVRVGTRG